MTVRQWAARADGIVGNANVTICGESYRDVGKGAKTVMNKRKLLIVGLTCAVALVFAVGVRGDAAGEIRRLAGVMPFGAQGKGWGPPRSSGSTGTVVADIGAGDGKYAFAAVERGGGTGKVDGGGVYGKELAGVGGGGGERETGDGRLGGGQAAGA